MMKKPFHLVLIISSFLLAVPAWSADLFIYLNAKNTQELQLKDVRNVFDSKQLEWKGGKSIVLLVPDFRQIDDEVFEAFVDMTKSQFLARWRAKFFSGRARMPIQYTDFDDALKFVKETEDSVYYSFKPIGDQKQIEGLREERFSF